ncbi:MAG: hypothetical protein C4536_15825 [Actinobacteria bacterium]|nr:MAG: hypothetical protein C4536_15825 [Actinomycetota bacterium]
MWDRGVGFRPGPITLLKDIRRVPCALALVRAMFPATQIHSRTLAKTMKQVTADAKQTIMAQERHQVPLKISGLAQVIQGLLRGLGVGRQHHVLTFLPRWRFAVLFLCRLEVSLLTRSKLAVHESHPRETTRPSC